MFGSLGTTEILLIVGTVLVFFGAKKIPDLAKGLGRGIRDFKKELQSIKDDFQSPNQ